MRLNQLAVTALMLMLGSGCALTAEQPEGGANAPSYDAELSDFDYPYAVKTFALASQRQSLKMRYMVAGPDDAERTAVLLHGKNFAGFYWRDIAELLVARGFRVIMPDQIGFGKSSKPAYYQYSFAQLALNTERLLNELGVERYTLVGHSMGGMLATTMALNYSRQIDNLVLINPIGLEPYLQYVTIKDPAFFYQMEMAKTPEKIRQYQRQNYYDGDWSPAYERLIAPHIGWMNGPDWQRVAWNNALTYMPIFAEDITARFARLSVPTHLIIGARDRTGPGRAWKKPGVERELGQYPELAKQAERAIANAELYLLEDLGHLPQFEDFDRFKTVFLQALNGQ